MRTLSCEMCRSNNVVKQNGFFECQECGTKYSVKEARKIMFDDSIDMSSGDTKEDDESKELANLYKLARSAKEDEDAEVAAKYYEMILIRDSSSWEATFYSVYFKAMCCKDTEIYSAARSIENCERSVFPMIKKSLKGKEQALKIWEVKSRCSRIAYFLASATEKLKSIRTNYTQEYYKNISASRDIMYTCGDLIDSNFSNDIGKKELAKVAWEEGIDIQKKYNSFISAEYYDDEKVVLEYTEKIKKYEDIHSDESKKKVEAKKDSSLKQANKLTQKYDYFHINVSNASKIDKGVSSFNSILKSTSKENENKVNSNYQKIQMLNNEIASLNIEISTLNGEILSLDNDVSSLGSENTKIEGEIVSLEEEITCINSDIDCKNEETKRTLHTYNIKMYLDCLICFFGLILLGFSTYNNLFTIVGLLIISIGIVCFAHNDRERKNVRNEKNKQISNKNTQIADKQNMLEEKQKLLSTNSNQISFKKNKIGQNQKQINDIKDKVKLKQNVIDGLNNKV